LPVPKESSCQYLGLQPREAIRQAGEFGDEVVHVPAAAASDLEVAVSTHERAEAVPLGFEGIVATLRQASGAQEHRSREPHGSEILVVRLRAA
jgi:hypothetical protein